MGSLSRPALLVMGLWLALLAGALALSALAASHDTLPGDEGIMSWLQDQPLPGQTLSDAIRWMAPTEVLVAGGAVGAALLWTRGYRREAVTLAVGLAVMALTQALVKDIVDRPRPSADLVEVRASYDSESFPSGHVMGSTYFYGYIAYLSLALRMERAARVALATFSVFVLAATPVASVWLGVHWPSDTLGGYLWGALLLLPAIVVCERPRREGRQG
jgi:undecaprenyl-diphosphatase